MLELLERQQKLTLNQKKIVFAAIVGDMLDFFDYYLIGFVLAFIVGPWHLTYGQSAIVLLSSGVGAIPGAMFWGWMADKIGRRKVFIYTILNFSLATGVLALTPDTGGWIFLTVFRFFVGFGVAGLYAVDLPLVQEFVPSSKRGKVGGLVTACLPLGTSLGAFMGGFLTPYIGWRGIFVVGLLPALMTLVVRAWVPESPRWLLRMGRVEEARKSLAWALMIDPEGNQAARCGADPAQSQLERAVPAPAQPGAHLAEQPRGADRRLRTDPVGADLVRAAACGVAGGRIEDDGEHWLCRPRRASDLLVSLGYRRAPGAGRDHGLRRFRRGGARRLLPQLHHPRLFGVLADGQRAELYRERRLRDHRALFGRGVAVASAGHRHGIGLRFSAASGKIIGRPAGAGADRRLVRRGRPKKATLAAIDPAMFYLASWYLLGGIVFFFIGLETKNRSDRGNRRRTREERASAPARKPVTASGDD